MICAVVAMVLWIWLVVVCWCWDLCVCMFWGDSVFVFCCAIGLCGFRGLWPDVLVGLMCLCDWLWFR